MFHVKHLDAGTPDDRALLRALQTLAFLDSAEASLICSFAAQAEKLAHAAELMGSGVGGSFLQAQVLPAIAAWRVIRPHHRARIADLGAGAGAFALTAAILHPFAAVYAIDSSRRHCDFIANAALSLGLQNLASLCERSEVIAQRAGYCASFDVVGCRALAPGKKPHEQAAGLLRPGGVLLLWRTWEDEDSGFPERFAACRELDLHQLSPRLRLTRFDLDP
jgi:16S rRNA G527 N7-methylase RsmG